MISEKNTQLKKQGNRFEEYRDKIADLASKEKELNKADTERLYSLASRLGVEDGLLISNVPIVKNFGAEMLLESRSQIIKSLKIVRHDELMLVDLMLASYHRALRLERTINRILFTSEDRYTINEHTSKIIDRLYKAIEKANNQYLNAFVTLRNTKSPQPSIKIQAQNAVIGKQELVNNK